MDTLSCPSIHFLYKTFALSHLILPITTKFGYYLNYPSRSHHFIRNLNVCLWIYLGRDRTKIKWGSCFIKKTLNLNLQDKSIDSKIFMNFKAFNFEEHLLVIAGKVLHIVTSKMIDIILKMLPCVQLLILFGLTYYFLNYKDFAKTFYSSLCYIMFFFSLKRIHLK